MTNTVLMFVVVVLAVFRVNRLVIEDTILEPPRAWLLGPEAWVEIAGHPDGGETYRMSEHGFLTNVEGRCRRLRNFLGDLISCQWCLGVWLSFAAVLTGLAVGADDGIVAAWTPAGVWWVLALSLAIAGAQSLIYPR